MPHFTGCLKGEPSAARRPPSLCPRAPSPPLLCPLSLAHPSAGPPWCGRSRASTTPLAHAAEAAGIGQVNQGQCCKFCSRFSLNNAAAATAAAEAAASKRRRHPLAIYSASQRLAKPAGVSVKRASRGLHGSAGRGSGRRTQHDRLVGRNRQSEQLAGPFFSLRLTSRRVCQPLAYKTSAVLPWRGCGARAARCPGTLGCTPVKSKQGRTGEVSLEGRILIESKCDGLFEEDDEPLQPALCPATRF